MKAYTDINQSKKLAEILPTEEMQKQTKKKREQIVHNILTEYAKDNGLIKYEYPDGFYCFGNPYCQELADKKHEEWLKRNKKAQPYVGEPEKYG